MLPVEYRGRPLDERFWLQAEKRGPDECWPWHGAKDRHGYGQLRRLGRIRGAHRVAWELENGREPSGCVCHSCDNPGCVNPAHLWVGTHQDNMRDMVAKGRTGAKGGNNGGCRSAPALCRNGHPFIPENRIPNGAATTCRICRVLSRKAA